ncbi:uncharacterized protein LOC143883833 isoform X3 [Tasmannia lanceolata]|uniref:uncharacterized protein LOC143883833 isoform X3 n=1 Tax=Tasmannia lanceolata TaxID=3420 RepID=UPI0040635828
MKVLKLWRSVSRSRNVLWGREIYGVKMKPLHFMGILCIVMFFILYRTTKHQYQHTKMEARVHPFDTMKAFDTMTEFHESRLKVGNLPHGIVEASSDMELRPLWLTRNARLKDNDQSQRNLLAIPAGIRQKQNVNSIVQKFFSENFTVILFHYDGNVDGWHDLQWSNKAIHIVAHNQTKWWFAKRFLHPDVVSIYDYIFLWDEDLGVENFHPGRYLKIMKSEGLEISQPALDPNRSEIHHRITIRRRARNVHRRRIYDTRGSLKCSDTSEGPPCSGWVEGMAPVFSRSAWHCAWHLIQNDLVHGWGMDMKLGYCAQGDRTKKVGVIDSEYIVHQGIETLGGSSPRKTSKAMPPPKDTMPRRGGPAVNLRSEVRRQSVSELQTFRQRWDRAIREDKDWVNPFQPLNKESPRHHTKRVRRHHLL